MPHSVCSGDFLAGYRCSVASMHTLLMSIINLFAAHREHNTFCEPKQPLTTEEGSCLLKDIPFLLEGYTKRDFRGRYKWCLLALPLTVCGAPTSSVCGMEIIMHAELIAT